MNFFQQFSRQTRIILWFFAALIAAQIMYSAAHGYLEFQSWQQEGLFAYNKKSDFVRSQIIGSLFSLLPYAFFGVVCAFFSCRVWLGVSIGVCVALSDAISTLCFRGSTDGQTGISILFLYAILLFASFVIFLGVNFAINRHSSRRIG